MSWVYAHKPFWRIAELVMLLLAIAGPWTFDLINVPAEYPCSAPFIRLEGDYCGIPLSGIWILFGMVGELITLVVGLITGTTVLTGIDLEYLGRLVYPLGLLLLLLPFFSALLLILRGDSRGRQVFQVAAWSLAAGISLLLGIASFTRHFWFIWGMWLYIVLAAGVLVLELVTLVSGRSTVRM